MIGRPRLLTGDRRGVVLLLVLATIALFTVMVVNFSAAGAEAVSVGVGAAVVVTAVSAGWVLSSAGRALCFLPSERGAALLHHERIW